MHELRCAMEEHHYLPLSEITVGESYVIDI